LDTAAERVVPQLPDGVRRGESLIISRPVHDASYLELAARKGLPLATLDKALANAALEELVTLVGVA
jgi:predicted nucleic acid-binding protein